MHCILKPLVGYSDNRWSGCLPGTLTSTAIDEVVFTIKTRVDHVNALSAKKCDDYCEANGVRSDTLWALKFFLILASLAYDHGADEVQAHCVAMSSSFIDIICVSSGLNPGEGCNLLPMDLGFPSPTEMPDFDP